MNTFKYYKFIIKLWNLNVNSAVLNLISIKEDLEYLQLVDIVIVLNVSKENYNKIIMFLYVKQIKKYISQEMGQMIFH